MFKFFKTIFTGEYISVTDLVQNYDPATQQVGVKKGALDHVNHKRFMYGQRFEFNGNPSDCFVILPKERKDDVQSPE